MNEILVGDVIEKLRELADESVNCVVTSPPYWGLRDYGTGKWEGGDSSCSHMRDSKKSDMTITGHKNFDDMNGVGDAIYKIVCRRCGALRKDKQIGLEESPDDYVKKLVAVFREVRRVLRSDGVVWLNLGDSYAGSGKGAWDNKDGGQKETYIPDSDSPQTSIAKVPLGLKTKDLVGIPWRVALALQADGWWLRSDIIWAKPNPMPESVVDRPTKSHEYIFLLTKSSKYFYDSEAIKEPLAESTIGRGSVDFGGAKGRAYQPSPEDPNFRGGNEQWGRTYDYAESSANGRNKRSVWTVATKPFSEAHFATYPEELIEPCIKAGCPENVCSKCGKSRVRIVERKRLRRDELSRDNPNFRPNQYAGSYENINGKGDAGFSETKTVGWSDCGCGVPFVHGVVMDIFMGAGTTAVVAKKLHRDWLGIELNPDYVVIALKRIRETEVNHSIFHFAEDLS